MIRSLIILAIMFISIVDPASAELGNTVKRFKNSLIYDDLELKFLHLSSLSRGIHKYDGYYFMSKLKKKIYLVGLITERDEKEIVGQSLYFPDDPKMWNFFTVSDFIYEATGWKVSIKDIIKTIRPMFKDTINKYILLDEYEKQYQTVYSSNQIGEYEVFVKRIPAGDWVVTIAEKSSHIGP